VDAACPVAFSNYRTVSTHRSVGHSIAGQGAPVMHPRIELSGVYWSLVSALPRDGVEEGLARLHKIEVYGTGDGLRAALHVQLLENMVEMGLHSAQCEIELAPDLAIRLACGDHA
jgi:hypothetical protein